MSRRLYDDRDDPSFEIPRASSQKAPRVEMNVDYSNRKQPITRDGEPVDEGQFGVHKRSVKKSSLGDYGPQGAVAAAGLVQAADNLGYEASVEDEMSMDKFSDDDEEQASPSAAQQPPAGIMAQFAHYRDAPFVYMSENPNTMKYGFAIVFAALYNAYLAYCIFYYIDNDLDFEWCDELGFLIIWTAIVYFFLFYYHVVKRFWGEQLYNALIIPWNNMISKIFEIRFMNIIAYLLVILAIGTFLVIDAWDEPERLTSGAGVLVILLFGFLCSRHPGHVQWRAVVWGVTLQYIMGLLVLRWETGKDIFECLADKVTIFLDFTDEGSSFVYGYLVTTAPFYPENVQANRSDELTPLYQDIAYSFNTPSNVTGKRYRGSPIDTVFMFKTLSVIYFFAFCVSMLFYIGALQWIVMKLGWMLYVTMGTTAAESLNAAANIFLGQTEAPLLIKPFLMDMTKSEIHAVMTGGFATIAGTVLAAYISFGVDASQLISASVMAAPAALAFSKLFYPETEQSKTTIEELKIERGDEANILDAAAQGASTAIMLVMNIGASLIAFLAFIGFLNAICAWLGHQAGLEDDYLTFEFMLGKLFIPVAFIIGVPWEDCEEVGRLIGVKTIINEFAAYEQLGEYIDAGQISPRAAAIATYALCGFANPGSIGIQLGGLGAMAPERKNDLAQIVLRAFVAGCTTSLLNAAVAGSLISTN